MTQAKQSRIATIILSSLIATLILGYIIFRVGVMRPLNNEFEKGDTQISELKAFQDDEDKRELLEQINKYRDGLYALNIVLEARKNVTNAFEDEILENPYLVFNYSQVLDDLRRLLPDDTHVTKFQANNKGMITMPVESIDYASLGRVLKSFKDKGYDKDGLDDNTVIPRMFTEVKIPSGAQRTVVKKKNRWGGFKLDEIYSLTLQYNLDPEFWQNPMPYPDVGSHLYYSQAIRDLTLAGTIEGYPDKYFRPNKSINRAEFFKVALFEFLSNDTISIEEYEKYVDLSEDDWHYQYIQLANNMGIAEGDEASKFHPDQSITRIEALKTILKIFEELPEKQEIDNEETDNEDDKEAIKEPINLPFEDVTPQDDIYPIVRASIDNGFFSKTFLSENDNKLKPDQKVSRAEICYWIWKLKFYYLQ